MSEREKLLELMRLHDEAFDHAMREDNCHKSSEGYVELRLTNVFERMDGEEPLKIKGVGIYSYVLGPNRLHDFDSIDEALATVREWHAAEMWGDE